MSSTEADNIDKLYKNYDILSDAKDKISEVSIFNVCICWVCGLLETDLTHFEQYNHHRYLFIS